VVTRLFVLLALLWHIVLPRAGVANVSDAPSLRSARSTFVSSALDVRPTTREAARSSSDAAPVALLATDRAIVARASFVRLPAPAFERVASPALDSIAPVARGPPAG
jgi:hypothetical protein